MYYLLMPKLFFRAKNLRNKLLNQIFRNMQPIFLKFLIIYTLQNIANSFQLFKKIINLIHQTLIPILLFNLMQYTIMRQAAS